MPTAPKVVHKTADETVNNSTTLQNDDHLYFAMAANEIWAFDIILLFASSTAADFIFSFSLPTGATLRGFTIYKGSGETLTSLAAIEGNAITCMGAGSTTPRVQAIFKGLVFNGANAGNFQLTWAQGTAEATDTVLKKGSCIIFHKIA